MGYGFSAKDWTATITNDAAVNGSVAGAAFEFKSWEKCTVDPGIKAAHVKGHRMLPEFIAKGTTEPKVSFDGALADEVSAARRHTGGIGGSSFTITLMAKRPGGGRFKITPKGCEWSGGGDTAIEDSGTKGKLEALCLDIFEKPSAVARDKSIYNKSK